MQVYRIADSRHPIWDGTGAAMVGGRWNSPGRPVIYASLSYACAMLEILVCANVGRIPAVQACVVAETPENLAVERHGAQSLPVGWDGDDPATARRLATYGCKRSDALCWSFLPSLPGLNAMR